MNGSGWVQSAAQSIAERVAALAESSSEAARHDVTIVVHGALDDVVVIAFRPLGHGSTPVLGLAYDLAFHPSDAGPAHDRDAAAYHILTFEVVEPHHHPVVLSDSADAIHWRVMATDDAYPAIVRNLPTTVSAAPAALTRRPFGC